MAFLLKTKQKANDQSNSKRQREWGSDRFNGVVTDLKRMKREITQE